MHWPCTTCIEQLLICIRERVWVCERADLTMTPMMIFIIATDAITLTHMHTNTHTQPLTKTEAHTNVVECLHACGVAWLDRLYSFATAPATQNYIHGKRRRETPLELWMGIGSFTVARQSLWLPCSAVAFFLPLSMFHTRSFVCVCYSCIWRCDAWRVWFFSSCRVRECNMEISFTIPGSFHCNEGEGERNERKKRPLFYPPSLLLPRRLFHFVRVSIC